MDGFIVACATLLCARAPIFLPVQRMSCASAIAYVQKHHRLMFETVDGLVPIYPIIARNETPICAAHETTEYIEMPTLDDRACVVGYQCH